ncbi:lipopolysaccharide biosynthesis protein [Nocardioides currus]|uniref:Polysaccharide biosynthesis protein n=1 Tax=Nocardioides currus TaxID=2133958 RepID=A0A2R7YS34_9ACTN|nr:polysaccharide biosynthesis protein [Nocardioides currus]PUA79103.1 polysaccharide biosynthesis protein [Nocardioides currus]
MRDTVWRLADSSSGIAVSMAIMNFATYGFVLVAPKLLGTAGYGALGSSLNLMLVISVGALGLQATAARRISAEPQHVAQIEDSIMRVTYRAAAALGLIMLLLSPLIQALLKLDHLETAVIIAVSAVPMTLMGGLAGILQGERRWAALGVLYIASGVPRLVIGGAIIAWRATEFWALVGVGISFWAPVLVGWWALRHERRPHADSAEHTGMALLKESIANGQALFAFFALSSIDLIVARNVLSEHDSGLYAGGLILTKAMLFLPQFVVIVAFPSMSTGSERRRALVVSLSLVGALGAVGTLAAWLLSGIAINFVGGEKFSEVEPWLWVFAILGTLLSMIQLLVYSVLARQSSRSVYVVWVALAVMVGAGLMADTVLGLVTVVVVVDLVLLVVLLGISAWFLRDSTTTVDEPAPISTT